MGVLFEPTGADYAYDEAKRASDKIRELENKLDQVIKRVLELERRMINERKL